MAGQGSTGNVIAALASFFIPGLGQLLQGRLGMALVQFCLTAALWKPKTWAWASAAAWCGHHVDYGVGTSDQEDP